MNRQAGEKFYFDGREYFSALIEAMNRARQFIDLESYIFELDHTGRMVLSALKHAARRGVRVRLLVDGFGSWTSIAGLTAELESTPVQFRVYRPILFNSSLFAQRALRNLSRRNHRKTCVIDGESAWIGSFNVSDVHTRRLAVGPAWRDSAIRLHDSGFPELTGAFERAWGGPHRRHLSIASQSRFLLNCNSAQRSVRNKILTRHLKSARARLWVTTPYFSPDHRVMSALRAAAAAGADVRVLLPKTPDVPGMRWINSVFYRQLYRSGLRIYLYRSSVLHAKTILADGWAIIGSSNLNHRSWLQDLEVDAIVTDAHALESLRQQFMLDLEQSEPLLLADPKRDSPLVRVTDQVALCLRHWT